MEEVVQKDMGSTGSGFYIAIVNRMRSKGPAAVAAGLNRRSGGRRESLAVAATRALPRAADARPRLLALRGSEKKARAPLNFFPFQMVSLFSPNTLIIVTSTRDRK